MRKAQRRGIVEIEEGRKSGDAKFIYAIPQLLAFQTVKV